MQAPTPSKAEFYEKLISSMYRKMLSLAQKQIGNPPDAEDVVQDVCGLAWEKIDTLMAHPKPEGWLMEALKRYIYRHFDQVRKDQTIAAALEVDEERSAVSIPDPEERSVASVLSPTDLRVVGLRDMGYTNTEIASIIGTTHGAVRVRVSRIIDKAKKFLSGEEKVENV